MSENNVAVFRSKLETETRNTIVRNLRDLAHGKWRSYFDAMKGADMTKLEEVNSYLDDLIASGAITTKIERVPAPTANGRIRPMVELKLYRYVTEIPTLS